MSDIMLSNTSINRTKHNINTGGIAQKMKITVMEDRGLTIIIYSLITLYLYIFLSTNYNFHQHYIILLYTKTYPFINNDK